MTTTRSIGTELQAILDYLFDVGIVLLPNSLSMTPSRVSWRATNPLDRFLDKRDMPTVRGYRTWAEAGEYTAMLADGALLQITYQIAGGRVVAHRLAYIPCPFDIDSEYLQSETTATVMDLYSSSSSDEIILRSAIRFDYDEAAAKEGHPAAHLTINTPDCRIACEAPLRLAHFFKFVFKNFYPSFWNGHDSLWSTLSKAPWEGSTVTETEREDLHVAWRRPS